MADTFQKCLAIILKEEGGNDDDPRDHGGRTSRGITQREYDAWRETHPGLPADVWQAPQGTVADIYKTQYFDPYCNKLPAGVDLCFFNASVNSGRTQAVKELQRALGVNVDGMIGIITMKAVNEADKETLIHAMSDRRRAFYKSLRQFNIYGKGWMARTGRVEQAAIAMAQAAPARYPAIDTLPDQPKVTVSAKANPTDTAKPPLSIGTATTGTALSSITSGVSQQLQQASDAIQPLAETFQIAKWVCLGITVVCACLAIYAIVHKNRVEAAV